MNPAREPILSLFTKKNLVVHGAMVPDCPKHTHPGRPYPVPVFSMSTSHPVFAMVAWFAWNRPFQKRQAYTRGCLGHTASAFSFQQFSSNFTIHILLLFSVCLCDLRCDEISQSQMYGKNQRKDSSVGVSELPS